MKYLAVVALVFVVGCSGGTHPVAPTPVPPPVSSTPPPVVTPPTTPTTPAAPTFPPGFDLAFYKQLAHNAFESPARLEPLRRQAQAPFIYLFNHDDAGRPIDAVTLDMTAAALINTTGALTGAFGLAGLEIGPSPAPNPSRVHIYVSWSSSRTSNACGTGSVGGRSLTLYPLTPGCRCPGNPATIDMGTVRHELGHVLGFWHTDNREDLMYRQFTSCNAQPSAREILHAAVAYTRPIGSLAP